MKKSRRFILGSALAGLGVFSTSRLLGTNSALLGRRRRRLRLDRSWQFHLGDVAGAETPEFSTSGWRNVELPHDWSIGEPFDLHNPSGRAGGFAVAGVGWYRITFKTGLLSPGEAVLVEFDGVYKNSQVWINGEPLGLHRSGYLGFEHNLTPYLNPGGDNVIAVRVDNSSQPDSRWYTGSGIYRHVWLTMTADVRVARSGTYVTTPNVNAGSAAIRISTSVTNKRSTPVDASVESYILCPDGRMQGPIASFVTIRPNDSATAEQEGTVMEPRLWSIEDPALYTVHTAVRVGGVAVDDYETTFGIRESRFDRNQGFLLNGKPLKLKGVCLHHDLGCLGAAAYERAIERRLETLVSMGCNAVRCSHNPPSREFLDACDRLGLLVVGEAFDKWDLGFAGEFEQPEFTETWRDDLGGMLARDRNHPSIILWSVGNEAGLPGTEDHDARLQELTDFVRQMEPTRPVTAALIPQIDGTVEDIVESIARSARYVDVLSLNYQEQWYELYRERIPSLAIIGSESYPYFRGIPDGYETKNNWWDVISNDYVAGQFVWVGFDYLGESAGWPSKGWPNGLIDTCGLPKPRSFFHQVVWPDNPAVRLAVIDPMHDEEEGLPPWRWPTSVAHWTFPGAEGRIFAVTAPSNCETVELILNDFSFGQEKSADFENHIVVWNIRYAPGTLRVVARNGGVVVAEAALRTAGEPRSIRLRPDRVSLSADGQDLAHVIVEIVDEQGELAPSARRLIDFTVQGPAKLVGTDNGDLRSAESYTGNRRTTFNGKCIAIVRTEPTPGKIRLSAISDGLTTADLTLSSRNSLRRAFSAGRPVRGSTPRPGMGTSR